MGAEVERLVAIGWRVMSAKGSPEERYSKMAYVTDPAGGIVLELAGR